MRKKKEKYWKVVDPELGERVDDVIRTRTWYARQCDLGDRVDFFTPPRRQMPVGREQELLNIYSGSRHPLEIPARRAGIIHHFDLKLEEGYQPRHMETSLQNRRVLKGRWLYLFDCECGNRVVLTAEETYERERLGLACGMRSCGAPRVDRQIWYRPRLALMLQVIQLKVLFPHLLGEYGTVLDPKEVVASIYANEEALAQIKEGKWWISGVAEREEVIQDKVSLTRAPDEKLFPSGQMCALLEDWPVTLNELCEIYDLDYDTAVSKRLLLDDERLIEELLGEKI